MLIIYQENLLILILNKKPIMPAVFPLIKELKQGKYLKE